MKATHFGSDLAELSLSALDAISDGLAMNFSALNPQPIPPGRTDWAMLVPQPLAPLWKGPGCPGPF
jgi:hypothetical protein